MRHAGILPVLAAIIAAGCLSCSSAIQKYQVPEKANLGGGTFEYVNSPLFEGAEAGAFDPKLGSPEAAVVKFLCSFVRKDEAFEEALVPLGERDARLDDKLETWREWKVTKWRLRTLYLDDDRAALTVYFGIAVQGEEDDGEDEFSLIRRNGIWLILYPPT